LDGETPAGEINSQNGEDKWLIFNWSK
jgi:hypothetical protein